MLRHFQVSSWIPDNRPGDCGNDGQVKRKKNEPDSRGLEPAHDKNMRRQFGCYLNTGMRAYGYDAGAGRLCFTRLIPSRLRL